VRIAYPRARTEVDFTARPFWAARGQAVLRLDGKRVVVQIRRGAGSVAASRSTTVVPVAARDAHGNSSRTDTQ
jgi:hypothetical protein